LCKGPNGDLISEKALVLRRWKQYFCELLNYEDLMVSRYQENILLSTDTEITIPIYEEINGIINKLKSNRAPGPDNITGELIKNGGCTLKRRIYKQMLNIWNCEQIPEEWPEGVICPIFKKGDHKECNNYRPITLLNVVYKIFAILLYN
jgi:hypothetical protein